MRQRIRPGTCVPHAHSGVVARADDVLPVIRPLDAVHSSTVRLRRRTTRPVESIAESNRVFEVEEPERTRCFPHVPDA